MHSYRKYNNRYTTNAKSATTALVPAVTSETNQLLNQILDLMLAQQQQIRAQQQENREVLALLCSRQQAQFCAPTQCDYGGSPFYQQQFYGQPNANAKMLGPALAAGVVGLLAGVFLANKLDIL